MMSCIHKWVYWCNSLKDFPPLFFRLILAFGFYHAAIMKMHDMSATQQYFQALNIPAASIIAYMVTGFEALGCILLVLGLATRTISFILLLIMLGAIFIAHIPNGLDYTLPTSYALALFSLMSTGGGRFSIDCNYCPAEKALRGACSNRER